jgi:hypothetical protein
MTSASPTRRTGAARPQRRGAQTGGLKALVTAATLAVVVGGWAAIAAPLSEKAVAAKADAQRSVLPAVEAAPGGISVNAAQPGPAALPPTTGLRSVAAPRPVAITRSSR